MTLWSVLQEQVFTSPSTDDLFNPYNGLNTELDVDGADRIRRNNLRGYLEDHADGVHLLLVAEAPGPWGCRFSGVPITSEAQLLDTGFPAKGRQTSRGDRPLGEYSAGIYWGALQPYYDRVFTWNTLPLHPHKSGKPLSIRPPRASEVDFFLPVLEAVLHWSRAERVVAIGRKAESALKKVGCDVTYVRHPSQGGANLFRNGISEVLGETGLLIKETDHAI
jgi:hypothetical protein